MARALFAPARRLPAAGEIPLAATWHDYRVDGKTLRALTGLAADSPYWPLLYPLVSGFRLQMALLTHPAFPFPIWRALQIRNHAVLHRSFGDGAALKLHTRTAATRILDKGTEIDLQSEASLDGTTVWESTNTIYYRRRQEARDGASPLAAAPVVAGSVTARWRAPGGARTRFAALTGDYNGIHLWTPYARRLGFRGAFAHPQRALGECLARLAPPEAGPPLRLDAWLKGPVYYGAPVALRIAEAPDTAVFALHVADDTRPALVGSCSTKTVAYFTSSSSTSKTSVAFGGMTPPAPRLP